MPRFIDPIINISPTPPPPVLKPSTPARIGKVHKLLPGRKMRNVWMHGLLSMVLMLAACGSDDDGANDTNNTNNTVVDGEALFMEAQDDGNSFACNSCHAISEPASDYVRPGHPIGDAVARPTFKNGQLTDIRDAVNSCRTEWMNAPAFDADDDRWVALLGYLEGLNTADQAPALTYEIVAPPSDAELVGGDAMDGQEFFNGSCAVCHGPDAVGTQQAPPLDGSLLDATTIARRVRTSGRSDSSIYDGLTGGVMPFWAADRISDDQLRDVVAFVLANSPAPNSSINNANNTNNVNNTNNATNNANNRECGSTHPSVGSTADFVPFAHNVGGVATIVDDCTIQITSFIYDGQGVNVQIYGGMAGNFDNGFSMSDDIRQAGGYLDATLTVKLPVDKTLDDIEGVSVWCVPVGASFGDAIF